MVVVVVTVKSVVGRHEANWLRNAGQQQCSDQHEQERVVLSLTQVQYHEQEENATDAAGHSKQRYAKLGKRE
jgi:hypothetical protein